MKAVIDRFEGDFAVAVTLSSETFNIKIENLPKGIKEGDVINIADGKITFDREETEKLKKESEEYLKLWED
ncbi:Protein of unknown function [Caloramator quimbayensis]|uniref:DUF3006 domain-containing protein n=1 Tax=Caloramator quimbayensis TaxID=1147123 RepID=A0A1T4WF02_9CLOT|nr:DUF3006 domain-containing protein [Caloramator quimbayensis]SKA75884.1 Protein of unknown function [Caloramator quimbayensis]